MYPKADACKSKCPKTRRNTTFTWLNYARPSTTSRDIIGAHTRDSYRAHVTVNPYNGCIRGTNPIVRHVGSLTCTLKQMRANQHAPEHAATQPLHDSNTRARAPNLRTQKVTNKVTKQLAVKVSLVRASYLIVLLGQCYRLDVRKTTQPQISR